MIKKNKKEISLLNLKIYHLPENVCHVKKIKGQRSYLGLVLEKLKDLLLGNDEVRICPGPALCTLDIIFFWKK